MARLPKSLAESVEALEKDTVLRDLIGEKLLVAIIGVRKVMTSVFLIWIYNVGLVTLYAPELLVGL